MIWLDDFDREPMRIKWEAPIPDKPMRYYLDTEFIENGPREPVHLLSIALVTDPGLEERQFYAQNRDCPLDRANEWVTANVLPHLGPEWESLARIRTLLAEFLDPGRYGPPEIWGYFADYDWVVFCQIFGTMADLPQGYPMYCRDLKQWADELGVKTLPPQIATEHHALNDARWNREVWHFLDVIERDIAQFPRGAFARARSRI